MMPSHFDINEVVACDTHEPCLGYDILSPVPFVVNPMYSPQEEEDDCDEFPDIPQSLDHITQQQQQQQQPQLAVPQRSFSDVLNGPQYDFSLFPPDQSFPDVNSSAPYVEPRRVSLPARNQTGNISKPNVATNIANTDYSVFVQQLMAGSNTMNNNMNYIPTTVIKEEQHAFGNYSFDFTQGQMQTQLQPQQHSTQLLTQSIDIPLPDVNLSITPPQPSTTPLPATVTIKEEHEPPNVSAKPEVVPEVEEPVEVDFNGRKHRKWRNRKYKCKHCDEIFYDKNLEEFAAHIQKVEKETGTTEVAGRHYKCESPDCLWHIIGFVRKLEAQKHYDRRHGHPKFQCRFWCEGDMEKFPGSKTCSTRWHVDSGNRARHERAVHGQVFEQSKFSS
ncbi:hypothetical protein B0I72DRAFT_93062 [Yarrowia lipolytica]|jgi:hypothetical protein|uniref:YALI0E10505p n=3 Tax=Yarrowia lipolytica TaxID=4952 RepID=Q6C6C9_YARLI|nr:YALI0E10505p [Yarrowia lipolytica CLIB122]QNQ00234.1 Hypothetical protein YALI2_E01549g [Yarrowia lipolytica]RDW25254.1 hypothetical protein B0I71DRAFT_165458 [Yarrowia lipolytica]RDW34574.1 hypothetical protein B0I72DRAFT_93062 [Yarrowia lipolytica]RDW38878.1 hypothetical protein B0I73DRAFT_40132 [Yarrowia lipolytica]CAG79374.1 YALI0E10505p [Yarrowia lipolytica CLIB122]|eukprot:XP_503783.1 YALI0E10505p [Yarrowia lipolytica CLIB122]